MTITRGIAAAALIAGVAVGASGTAWADQTMSGHYTWTTTTPTGKSTSGDIYFTPCGDGCASAASTPGGPAVGQARLVNGQWTMNGTWPVDCPDATPSANPEPSANPQPYVDTWDPNTLAGTDVFTYSVPTCGSPAGYQQINKLQYRQAP
jgi:hypothetical protein